MRHSQLSLLTAFISLLGALVWLACGRVVSGLLWIAISIGWLLTAAIQLRKSDPIEPARAHAFSGASLA